MRTVLFVLLSVAIASDVYYLETLLVVEVLSQWPEVTPEDLQVYVTIGMGILVEAIVLYKIVEHLTSTPEDRRIARLVEDRRRADRLSAMQPRSH